MSGVNSTGAPPARPGCRAGCGGRVHALAVVRSLGGYATRADLVAGGVTRRGVDRALRTGVLLDAGRGGYVAPDASPALRTAARVRGMVACVSAPEVHGLVLGSPDRVPHVVVRSTRTAPGAVWHRDLPGRPVEPPLPAAVRALCCTDRHGGLVVVDALLRTGVERGEFAAALGARPGESARWAVRHGDPRAESPLESRLRALLVDAGIHGVEPQVRIAGMGRVDLLVDGWLVVEADGFAFHADRSSYRNDRRRGVLGCRAGYVTLRFSWEDVVGDPAWTLAMVRAALDRRTRGGFRTAI